MMISHGPFLRASMRPASVHTRSLYGSKAPFLSSLPMRKASSSQSSTIRALMLRIVISPFFGRFVQYKPVKPELFDGLKELGEVDWLSDVAVSSELIAIYQVLLLL